MADIPEPVDPDGIAVVTAGTALWLVALLVLIALHDRLARAGHSWWIGTAAAGFALGVLGIGFCRRRRGRRRSAVQVGLEP